MMNRLWNALDLRSQLIMQDIFKWMIYAFGVFLLALGGFTWRPAIAAVGFVIMNGFLAVQLFYKKGKAPSRSPEPQNHD